MKQRIIRICQITFITLVALLYLWRAVGTLSSAWQQVSEVNATFAPEQRAQLREATRTIGAEHVLFLFHPDKNLFLYRDEQGAEHVADYRLHLFLHDRALELDFEEDDFIPILKEKTLSPSPKLTAALNTLRQTPAYPLSLRDRISLAFDIAAWHIAGGLW